MAFLSAIGPVLSGVFSFMQGMAQAKVAEMNADVAEDNARRTMERTQVQEEDNDAQTAAILGQQEAAVSASGLDINSDTARRVRRSAQILGRRDTLNIRQAAEIEKYNYLVQKENFKAEAANARIGGVGSLLGGFLQGASGMPSLLGSAAPTGSPIGPARPYMKPNRLVA